jgi:hypothetical protein
MRRAPDAPPASARVWPLDGPRATMLHAIVSALAILRSAVPRSVPLPADIDLVAHEGAEGGTIAETTRLLVTSLLDEMAAGDDPPLPADPDALGALQDLANAAPFRISRAHRRDALGDAAAIIREVGLERHDLDCHLGSGPDGQDVIVSAPISPATAHVWLLDRLFQRAEVFVLGDEVLTRERMASAWYFSRWSVGGHGLDREAMAFTRNVREQEWSLVERETAALDVPVMEALVHDERFARIPARQQRLAGALVASIVDVFVVEAVEGDRVTVRSVRGGRAHRVHEHNTEARMYPGYLVIGRLIPFEHDLWLRSPGTVSFLPNRPDEAAIFAEALSRVAGTLPLPIAIEALISTTLLGGKPPVSPKPAPSAREARELLQFMTDALDELGLREEVPVEDIPDDMAARLPQGPASEMVYFRISTDAALAEWMSALTEQAERGEPGRSSGPKGRGEKKGKKKRRR